MKGIVFTELLDMVEKKFGYELVDKLLSNESLPSGGAYTAIGTYEFSELVTILTDLSKYSGIAMPELMKAYGHYLHGTFAGNYGAFFDAADSAFDFLESIENHIHVEVKKLYPDAQLPSFDTKRIDDSQLEMIYKSERKMGPFALGLIQETIAYYKEDISVEMKNVNAEGSEVQFMLTKNSK